MIFSILIAFLLIGTGALLALNLPQPKTVILSTDSSHTTSNSPQITDNLDTMTVVGQSKPVITPQVALLNLGVETCNADAQKANEAINERVQSLINGLVIAGVKKTDINPVNFSMYPRYAYNSGPINGFCAQNRVKVRTTKLDQVSIILDKAIASGATSVYGVNFTTEDIEKAKQDGIRLAYEDAEKQATALAKSMDKSLLTVISSKIDLSGDLIGVFIGYSGGGGYVSPQDDTLTIKVTVVYAIGN